MPSDCSAYACRLQVVINVAICHNDPPPDWTNGPAQWDHRILAFDMFRAIHDYSLPIVDTRHRHIEHLLQYSIELTS